MGWGVAASAVSVGVWQGLVTVFAAIFSAGIPNEAIAAVTATGGILMLGIGLRVLNIRQIAVADLLPALIFAPLITLGVQAVIT
jgi:uncharacterized membrane protein YqgA involved in biofilm formation